MESWADVVFYFSLRRIGGRIYGPRDVLPIVTTVRRGAGPLVIQNFLFLVSPQMLTRDRDNWDSLKNILKQKNGFPSPVITSATSGLAQFAPKMMLSTSTSQQ
jgi:hypothetical protein